MKYLTIILTVLALTFVIAPTTPTFAGKPDSNPNPGKGQHQKPEDDYETGGPDDSANTGKSSDANNNDDSHSNGNQKNEWVIDEDSHAHNCDANGGHCVEEPAPEPEPELEATPQPTPTTMPSANLEVTPSPDPTPHSAPSSFVETQPVTSTFVSTNTVTVCPTPEAGCDECALLEQILEEEQYQTKLLERQNILLNTILSLLQRIVDLIV